jgi:hypothetical protein
LRYCAAEVDVAHERWERAVTAGTESADVVAGLERLARALAAASGLGLGSAARSREILARLKGIEVAARPGDTEAWLSAEERQLLEEIGREAPDLAARAAKEVADEIAPYRRRMPARVAEQIEKDALARRLLGVYGLPRLSLFLQ